MAQGTNIFLEQKLANFNHFIYLFFLSMKTEVTIFLRSYWIKSHAHKMALEQRQ